MVKLRHAEAAMKHAIIGKQAISRSEKESFVRQAADCQLLMTQSGRARC
jgi:hypothetical protein